ncbi:hypothetical protein KI387_036747, partial [Taxus chinensis]
MRPLIMGCIRPGFPVVLKMMISVMKSTQMEVYVGGVFEEDLIVEVIVEEEGVSSHVEHVSNMDLQNITS